MSHRNRRQKTLQPQKATAVNCSLVIILKPKHSHKEKNGSKILSQLSRNNKPINIPKNRIDARKLEGFSCFCWVKRTLQFELWLWVRLLGDVRSSQRLLC